MAAGHEQCADATIRLPRSPPRSLKAAGGDDRTEGRAAAALLTRICSGPSWRDGAAATHPGPRAAMKCSSPQNISAILRRQTACTSGWLRRTALASWPSPQSGTCSLLWSSTPCTTDSAPTTSGRPTDNLSPRLCDLLSTPRNDGPTTEENQVRRPGSPPAHQLI